ncbi:hypothetical protein TRFO_09243 [Tritrichomonas foetus]|uniref:WDHD1/CFT4 second beta-propeller domain-containing protein n=1 Tax=Tritrichomonas foetus TaxID=1144522 RepID=A0A1J4JF99_9EUKA|nr:hypothetical protein TRFO_09243 [Tritrichomonas foetus]|eukprot:OHS97818.1 hypothetical protein TRFO_09243 [Tritrichomonas foetus]
MNLPRERKQTNNHFGSCKQVSFDPFTGEDVISLGKDDNILNCFNVENLTISSVHNLNFLEGNPVLSFCFCQQSSTFLVALNSELISCSWPNCGNHNTIFSHNSSIEHVCSTSSEDLIAIADKSKVILLKKFRDHCDVLSTFLENSSRIEWIGFGPVCDTLDILSIDSSNSLILTAINSQTQEIIFQRNIKQSGKLCLPCFTFKSELLFLDDGDIHSISHLNGNKEAILQNEKHNSNIVAVAASLSTDHIATCDDSGTIIISQYDGKRVNLSENPDSPQTLYSILTFSVEQPCERITALSWGFGSLAAGDENGELHIWENVVDSPKPIKQNDDESFESSNKSNKKKGNSLTDFLNAPVVPRKKKVEDEDDSLSDLSDQENNTVEKTGGTKKKAPPKKPKKQQKKTKQQKKLVSNKYIQREKISDDEDESDLADFIEPAEEFEARLKEMAPEPEPEPEPVFLPSESSSDHEIDFEQYLDPEQRAKLHPKQEEEEEKNEGIFESGTMSDEEDILDEDDIIDFTFPFMPGNNDHFVGNRRYLCWNYYAAALLRREEEGTTEIDIHTMVDGKTKEIPNVNQFKFFTIDEHGFIGASDSDIVYEHHKSWAPDKTTSIFLQNEKAQLIACGKEWFAVATDAPCIRVFTSAGLEIDIISLPYNCTVMVGRDKYLFYAYPFGKDLNFRLISVLKSKVLIEGVVSVNQPIKWIGFDEKHQVFIQDHLNLVHFLSKDFSWQWIPVLDLKEYFDTTTDNYWVVKAENGLIHGVPLRSQKSPATYPIPKLHSLDTHILTLDTEVRPWLMNQIAFNIKKNKCDAELLKMFPNAIQSGLEYRAYHIAQNIKTKKARQFVVEYADTLDASVVADKLTGTIRKPQRKIITIRRETSSELRKKHSVSRSSSEDQVVYVRNAKDVPSSSKPTNTHNSNEENAQDEPTSHKPMNLFETLKVLGSTTTPVIAGSSKSDEAQDKKSKAKQKKKNMAPIVQKKRPRKVKNTDTSSFKPLFE